MIACEESQIVLEQFLHKGHDALSCDIDYPGAKGLPHYQGDVMNIINDGWDMIIAHPPCTYLCNSGVRWLYNRDGSKNTDRWVKMEQAALFFKKFLDTDCKKVVAENPIMHKYAVQIIGRKYDQLIHPWQFGHGETKATGLHLEGLPPLESTNIVEGREARIHKMPPGKDRARLRSTTYPGIAEAFASQWNF